VNNKIVDKEQITRSELIEAFVTKAPALSAMFDLRCWRMMERLPSVLTTNSGKVFGVEEEATLPERAGDPFDVWAPLKNVSDRSVSLSRRRRRKL
jgi:hypothetical protein